MDRSRARACGLVLLCALVIGLLAPPTSVAAGSPPADVRAAVASADVLAVAAARSLEPVAARRRGPVVSLRRMLGLINVVRSLPQKCGKKLFPAVGPLRRNKRLNRAATRYATKMARNDWFDHNAPDGTDPGQRITAAGYRWSRWGENIAAGYDAVPRVIAGWLASPGHCRTLMSSYRHVGFGHAYDADSTYGHYWVQDFATPR